MLVLSASTVGVGAALRIAITAEAFDAIAATLPLGSIGFERDLTDEGEKR
jgi:hypothetical protein